MKLMIFFLFSLFLLSSCLQPLIQKPDDTVPLFPRIVPKDPTTKERTLKRNCRCYVNVVGYEPVGWYRSGKRVITQDAENDEHYYKVFELDDYASGYIRKECFQ